MRLLCGFTEQSGEKENNQTEKIEKVGSVALTFNCYFKGPLVSEEDAFRHLKQLRYLLASPIRMS